MIKRFLEAYRWMSEQRPFFKEIDNPDFWTLDDAIWLRSKLREPSGQKLDAMLKNWVSKSAISACAAKDNGDYERGKARGVQLIVNSIEQLSPPAPAKEGNIDEPAEQEQAVLAAF